MYRLRKLALCVAVLLVPTLVAACGGSTADSSTTASSVAAPLPLWQRVLQSGELAGFVADAEPPKVLDLDTFVDQARVAFIQITPEQAHTELTSDGFTGALISGLSLPSNKNVIAASTVMRLGSPAQAERALAWSSADGLKSCPNTCNVEIAEFDVSDLPGAKGAHRSRTSLATGAGEEKPFESFDVEFVDGPFLYDVFVMTPRPGMISPQAVAAAARTLYQRVHGSPPLATTTTATA